MNTFYCSDCDATLINWPRTPSVDENGALMPPQTTEEAHREGHAVFAANDWPFTPLLSEV